MVDYHDLHSITPCQCPKCRSSRNGIGTISSSGGSSDGGGGKGYTSYPRRGGHTGRNVAIVLIALVAVGGIVYFINPFDLKEIVTNNPENVPDNARDSTPTEQVNQVTPEYYTEDEKVTLVDRGAYLGPGDKVTFEMQIPITSVTILEGIIEVDGKFYMTATFTDTFGKIYCNDCKIRIEGQQSGKLVSSNVSIPVNSGDTIKLTIENAPDAELQTVHVELYMTYPVIKQRIVPVDTVPVAEQLEQSDKISQPIVDSGESSISPVVSIDELRQYALTLINKDREKFNLAPVELSTNEAAQQHAEDILTTMQISHWMTNGEKPYMTYSRLGGTGYIAQNVAVSGDAAYYDDCTSGFYQCETIDPYSQIEEHEYSMLYDDLVCCDNGHRNNILDPFHTHVSIGIAYNDYFFVMVQNFENNYIDFNSPITTDNNRIQLTGQIPSDANVYGITVEYDPLPTSATYRANAYQTSYGGGDTIAGVAPPGSYYEDIQTIPATNWYEGRSTIDVRFSLESVADEPGVYTIVTWLEIDGEQVPVTSYAVFVEDV